MYLNVIEKRFVFHSDGRFSERARSLSLDLNFGECCSENMTFVRFGVPKVVV